MSRSSMKLEWQSYEEQKKKFWPKEGRHILANYAEDFIVVYQAYKPEIGQWAAKNGKFSGAPGYSDDRMTWIKTNFLWMMYRSDWATSSNQETILAIWLKQSAFDRYLREAALTSFIPEKHEDKQQFQAALKSSNIRLQWDPDHHPTGPKQTRRAVQLGLKKVETFINGEDILHIEDITPMVAQQRVFVTAGKMDELMTPAERVYRPTDDAICQHIGLDLYEN